MPFRTQSLDTSSEAERILVEHYRRLSFTEKVRIIEDLNRMTEDLALVGILERHPSATEEEQRLRLAALKYGRDLVVQAFGWDPEVEGW